MDPVEFVCAQTADVFAGDGAQIDVAPAQFPQRPDLHIQIIGHFIGES